MTRPLPGLAPQSVDAWLDLHLADFPGPRRFGLIAAGGSNLTFEVTDAIGRRLALRRPPEGRRAARAHDMAREWEVMRALAASPVPVPACLEFCSDESVTGAPFYVMAFVEGTILRRRTDADAMTTAQGARAATSLAEVQAALHQLDAGAVGLGELARPDDYVGRQLRRWRRQVVDHGARSVPLHQELYERLARAKPPERARPGLVHGDYRFDNTVLDQGGAVAAVLDWELCTVGDPIADFVWSSQYWSDPGDAPTFLDDAPTLAATLPSRAEYTARYVAATGHDLQDLPYYEVFSWWKQASIVEGVYSRRLSGSRAGGAGGPIEAIADRADVLLAHAHELATANL